jgi:hypothetical protein
MVSKRLTSVLGHEAKSTSPALGQSHCLSAGVFTSAPSVDAASLGQAHAVTRHHLAGHAVIEYRKGSQLRFDRFKPALQHAVVWRESGALGDVRFRGQSGIYLGFFRQTTDLPALVK